MREITSTRLCRAVRRRRLFFLLAMILGIADWRLPIAELRSGHQEQTARDNQGQAAGADGKSTHQRQAAGAGGSASVRTIIIDEAAQRKLLKSAPMEFTQASAKSQVVVTLPMPNGTFARFRVEESPVMAAQLAARFPDTKTYRGRGLDDPTATTRFDVTPAGFHAIVLTSKGTVIIEPAAHGRSGKYVSYDQREAPQEAGSFSCLLLGAEQARPLSKQLPRTGNAKLGVSAGTSLRTYRMALAATAEFTQTYGGGTVDGALSRMTTLINAVNAIYERDLGVHLTLIANETSIIFTNPVTDGYTSNNVPLMVNQNQSILDQRIGPSNYDIGMVMDGRIFGSLPGFVFQGAANYQSLCVNGRKGTAASVFRSTEPSTISAIYVVAHELAHMLGALHTFNSNLDDCGPSRFPEAAFELGSGSTIMGYRGGVLPDGSYYPICFGDDLLSTDTYFHTFSIEQIFDFTTFGSGSNCPVLTDTGNTPPSVDAGPDYTIPANTPFALTATASDVDADTLTYCWEEFDLGAVGPPHTDNGNRPIFRSFAPVPYPTRTFPQLSDILRRTSTFGESLPTTNRTMTFRVTVRDNHAGGGGVNTGAMHVNVVSNSGGFVVTDPFSSQTWNAGSNRTVTWNVANTSSAPVSCGNVRILLSIDGGLSFPFTLASSMPNSGAATINVPNLPTLFARVKVEAIDNIFFSISQEFRINPSGTGAPTLLTEANTNRALALDTQTFLRDPFSLTTPLSFGADQRTRIMLFALGLEFQPGENLSVVTAQAEDSTHRIYPLAVEAAEKTSSPTFSWFTQVNVRLPDDLPAGDVLVSVSLRGAESNKVIVRIR